MSDIHAVPPGTPRREGQCAWSWRWEGELLRCKECIATPDSWFCPGCGRKIEGDPE